MDNVLAYEIKLIGQSKVAKDIIDTRKEASQLKKALDLSNNGAQQKELSAELTKTQAKLASLRKTQRGYVKELEAANFAPGSYRAIQAEVAGLTERLRQSSVGLNVTAEEFKDMEARIKAGKIELADFDRELAASNQLVGEYDRGIINAFKQVGLIDEAGKIVSNLEDKHEKLNNTISELKNEYAKAGQAGARSQDEVQKELLGTQKQLNKLDAELEEARKEFKETGEAGKTSFDQINDLVNNLTQQIPIVGNLVGQLGGGLEGGLKVGAIVAGIGLVIDQTIDLGAEILNDAKAVTTLRGEVQRLSGETGAANDRIAATAQSIAEVYDQDILEVLRSANSLSREFGISQEDALGKIQSGFLIAGDAGGELLENIREYSTQFREAEFSADRFVGTIVTQATEGVFNDKLVDAVKEAAERIGRLSQETAAQEGLAILGLDPATIDRELQQGTRGIEQTIDQVLEEIAKLPEGSQTARIALENIFGTPGVDAGRRAVEELINTRKGLDDLIDPTNKLVQAQRTQLTINEDLAAAQIALTDALGLNGDEYTNLGTIIRTELLEVLASSINFLKENRATLENIAKVVAVVTSAYVAYVATTKAGLIITQAQVVATRAWAAGKALLAGNIGIATAAQRVFNTAAKLNPIGAIVAVIIAASTAYVLFTKELSKASKEQKLFNDVSAQAQKSVAAERAELGRYLSVAKNTNLSYEQRRKAVEKINEISPEFLGNITLETIENGKATEAIDKYIEALNRKALAKAFEAKQVELAQKLIEKESETLGENLGVYDELKAVILGFGNAASTGLQRTQLAIEKRQEETGAIKEQIELLDQLFNKKIQEGEIDIDTGAPAGGGGGGGGLNPDERKRLEKAAQERIEIRQRVNASILQLTRDFAKLSIEELQDARTKALAEEELTAEEQINKARETQEKIIAEIEKAQEGLDPDSGTFAKFEEQRQQVIAATNANIEQITENHRQRLLDINKQFDDEDIERQLEALDKRLEAIDFAQAGEVLSLRERLANKLITQEDFNDRFLQLEQDRLEKQQSLLNARLVNLDPETEAYKDLLKQKEEINRELRQLDIDRTNEEQEQTQQRIEQFADEFNQKAQYVSQAIDIIGQIAQLQGEKETEAIEEQIARREERIENLEELAENSSGSQQEIYRQQLQNERELAKKDQEKREVLEKKIRRRQKRIAIAQSIIDTAAAVARALANPPGPPFSVPQAIAAGVFGAAQTAIIAAQPLAKGGTLLAKDGISAVTGGNIPQTAGIISGRRHASGGVRFNFGGRPIEAEGGEIKTRNGKAVNIFTRGVTANPTLRKLALATDSAGFDPRAQIIASFINTLGGGRSFSGGSFLQDGGNLDSSLAAPVLITGQDGRIAELITKTSEMQELLSNRVEQVDSRIDDIKIVVPVDSVSAIQTDEQETIEAGLF